MFLREVASGLVDQPLNAPTTVAPLEDESDIHKLAGRLECRLETGLGVQCFIPRSATLDAVSGNQVKGPRAGLPRRGCVEDPCGQVLETALGSDLAAFEIDDAVTLLDTDESVRDDDHRQFALAKLGERVDDPLLGRRVEVRGRLVEHEHGRAHVERAREPEPLALAAGEPHAPLADDRLEPVGSSRRRRRAGRDGSPRRRPRRRSRRRASRARRWRGACRRRGRRPAGRSRSTAASPRVRRAALRRR